MGWNVYRSKTNLKQILIVGNKIRNKYSFVITNKGVNLHVIVKVNVLLENQIRLIAGFQKYNCRFIKWAFHVIIIRSWTISSSRSPSEYWIMHWIINPFFSPRLFAVSSSIFFFYQTSINQFIPNYYNSQKDISSRIDDLSFQKSET